MANYNKVILMGNLTRDPQLTYLPSQMPVCEFGIAVNSKWKDQQGQQREDVMFIDCRVFGKQADTFAKYMSKGKAVLIEGRLQLDTWEKDGQKRSKHRVTVQNFQFVGAPGPGQPGQAPRPAAAPPPAAPEEDFGPPPTDAPSGEDIPF